MELKFAAHDFFALFQDVIILKDIEMSVKVFYIPLPYRGSTEVLLRASVNEIKGPDYSRILYIAPTPRKVRDAQQIFHKIKGGHYIPPQMLTIKQLSKRLYSLYDDRHTILRQLIPVILAQISGRGMGFASIISDFISEIKQYHPGKSIDVVEKKLRDVFHDLGIPEEVSSRAMEAIKIFKTYQTILEKESILDEDDVMALCPLLIREHKLAPHVLILDGFYELTGAEESILKPLVRSAKNTLVSIPHDDNLLEVTNSYAAFINNNFTVEESFLSSDRPIVDLYYQPYPSIEDEAEGIARNIKHHFISGKITDLEKVIIAFPKPSEYEDIVGRIFSRYGIPYVISNSMSARRSRAFFDLLALLESVADDYPRLLFSKFLISPYFKNIPSSLKDGIPMLSLTSGIVKGKDAWLNLTKSGVKKENISLDIGRGLRWVFKKTAALESVKNDGTFNQYNEVIDKLLADFGFSDIGDPARELREEILESCKNLSILDALALRYPAAPGNRTYSSLHQYIDALRYILNTTDREREDAGVRVMSLFEMRGIEAEFLYMGGLKEGNLPAKPDMDYILPDSVRTQIGLINLKRYLLLQKFLFFRTIESAGNICLSYPVMEGDRFFLPSPLLPWNRERQERVSGVFSKEEELLRKGINPLSSYITQIEKVDDKFIRKKFGGNSYINVTDIDYYRSCPRKFFIEKLLHLEPLEIKEYKVEAMLLGSIVHEVMQFLLTMSFTDVEDLKGKAEKIISNILSKKPLEQYWKNLILDSFLSIVPEIYELESNLIEDGYSFMKAEVPVEGEILRGIKLKGKIDRIDKKVQSSKFKVQSVTDNGLATCRSSLVTDVVELIDYKTGMTQLRGTQVMTKGANLQLFLYAALMKSLKFNVERVGLYSLKDMHLSWVPGRSDRKNKRTIEDYIEISLRFLEETVSRMRAGDFSASPLDEQTCRNCSERPYCPYIQKTVTS
jgi:ATP-dependent helicase/DNAse subunit B